MWHGEKGWEGRVAWGGLPPLLSCEKAPSINSGSLHTACSRSSFRAAGQWTDAYLSLQTLFMQGMSGKKGVGPLVEGRNEEWPSGCFRHFLEATVNGEKLVTIQLIRHG